ncbi:hypothetical protein PPTG_24457, partial [Phytophthora nicotianae INRA-310]
MSEAKEGLVKFAEYADCVSFDDFKVIYYARFLEKDKAYVIKKKAKLEQAASDIRFLKTFATHVIKQETRNLYASYFKKFCEFCIANEYPDPAVTRHHELPSLLVAFMESVSASSTVSNQTAKKIRAAVANFYGSYEGRDAAGPDKWMVMTDDRGNKFGL